MAKEPTNPVKAQDRAFDLYDTWQKYGYCMFPQQRKIYRKIADILDKNWYVLEAGCGNGLGTAMLHRANYDGTVYGTDAEEANIRFCQQLYPWINFGTWDVMRPVPVGLLTGMEFDCVVAVEMLEHVADPLLALKNMLDACTKELWLSTPNGRGKKKPPENPYHVSEYDPFEVVAMVRSVLYDCAAVHVLDWETFEPVSSNTTQRDPLVYRVVKE